MDRQLLGVLELGLLSTTLSGLRLLAARGRLCAAAFGLASLSGAFYAFEYPSALFSLA